MKEVSGRSTENRPYLALLVAIFGYRVEMFDRYPLWVTLTAATGSNLRHVGQGGQSIGEQEGDRQPNCSPFGKNVYFFFALPLARLGMRLFPVRIWFFQKLTILGSAESMLPATRSATATGIGRIE